MSRLFIYDENMTDERAKITVAKMAAISDIVAPEKEYIQYSAQGAVTIMAGCVIAVGENAVFKTAKPYLQKQIWTREAILYTVRTITFTFVTLGRTPRTNFI